MRPAGGAVSGQSPPEPVSVADLGEFDLIKRITTDRRPSAATLLGPGDDAAVLVTSDGRAVASTDMLVEGVHFRLDWSTPYQVGRKAVAANLADVAAMGAVPTGLLVALACPPDTPVATVDALVDGMWEEAGLVGAGVAGGDLARGPVLVVSVTALGDLQGRSPVTRSGAGPGDVLAVCGRLGWAAAGLAVLSRGFRSPLTVVGAHRIPEPPYEAGPQAAAAGATAMIDISDGLLADAAHIARASGVTLDVDSAALPVPRRLVEVGSALGADPQHWVLTGGDDHALLASFPAGSELPTGWTAIGTVQQSRASHGLEVTVDGVRYDGPAGWAHFS